MDRFSSVLLVGGLGCFVLAFLLSGLYPWLITDATEPIATIEQVAYDVTPEFRELKDAYPVAFARAFPGSEAALTARELASIPEGDARRAASEDAWRKAHTTALRRGRDLYIGQVCWHCHSQYVRPVANESIRFGEVLTARHDNNELQRPVLWGTRRVGPDLTHVGGRRSNDWHVAHFWDPQSTSPGSVMPRYSWFLEEGYQVRRSLDPELAEREGLDPKRSYPFPGLHRTEAEAAAARDRLRTELPDALADERDRLVIAEGRGPTERGLALIAYLQWLGTWDPDSRPETP